MLSFTQVNCVIDSADVTVIDVSDSGNCLPLDEVFIGHHAMQYLEDEVALTTSDIHHFRESCLTWWVTVVKEAMKKLPLGHPLLCNLPWLQPGQQQYDKLSQVFYCSCLPSSGSQS